MALFAPTTLEISASACSGVCVWNSFLNNDSRCNVDPRKYIYTYIFICSQT